MAEIKHISDYIFSQNNIKETIEKIGEYIDENGLPERMAVLIVYQGEPFVLCGSENRNYDVPQVAMDMQRVLSAIYADDYEYE